MADFLTALGGFGDLDADTHSEVLANDFKALAAAWKAAMEEGAVAEESERWQIPCLIYAGTEDSPRTSGDRNGSAVCGELLTD
jgi:hypothetical protein